ncbi:diguanylate cyclase domain-containing protein [Pseudoduganella sp. UC29_106]|uniref:diguanylate cyclase domain-containing protein n=1 Tax=Pseudoduganella sp. UC29_106 TaxID=3374553 RepID=UPI003757789A
MSTRSLLPQSLKFRMSSVVILLVLAATVIVTWLALVMAERDMKAVIGRQQYSLLSAAAAHIDEQLAGKRLMLATLAEAIPAGKANEQTIRHSFEAHPSARAEFSNLVVFDKQGNMVATMREELAARQFNVASRPYFEQTLNSKRGLISPPVRSKISNLPVVVLTHPVIDSGGDVQYVIAGSIDLLNSDFFSQFNNMRPGKTGFMFIMTTEGILVNHPNKARLLEHINARPGKNTGTEMALAGFEGWVEARNKDGNEGIYSYKRLEATNWIVGVRYPTAEAFAPMSALRQTAIIAATAFAAVAGLLSWFVIDRLLAPLERLRAGLQSVRTKGGDISQLRTGRKDEIGEVSEALYELTAERQATQDRLRESEHRARMIADNIPALIAYVDRDLHYRFTNEHYRYLLGLDPKDMIGRSVAEVFGPEVMERWRPQFELAMSGKPVQLEREGEELGRHMHLMTHMIPDFAPDGSVAGVYLTSVDITERKIAELTQAASEQRLKLITDHLPVMISAIDSERYLQFGNATYQRWLGLDPDSLAGRPVSTVIGFRYYEQARPAIDLAFKGEVTVHEAHARLNGAPRILETTFVPDVRKDGSVPAVYALTHDVTRAREIEAELTQQARRDPLTGIANRRQFEEALDQAIERVRRQDSQMALAYLDIDDFKTINDTQGHGAGDEVLKEFALRLANSIRATDMVARLAGDEFVIIFENIRQPEEVTVLAEKIVSAIAPDFRFNGKTLHVTTSFGVALYQGGGETSGGLIGRADAALYETKRRGRNGYMIDAGRHAEALSAVSATR